MLELLRIRNLALIEDMELEFAPGLNVLTGETGAGKSFILKALNFITGDKLLPDMVRPGADKAQVEALFTLPDKELVIRRELIAETGRSRLYLNDQLSSQEAVKELRSSLIVHASQHGQQKLLQPSFQAHILDSAMNRPELVARRDELLKNLRDAAARKENLLTRFRALEDKREVLEFQRQEIDKVEPRKGEEEELEAARLELRELDHIRDAVEECLDVIHGDGSAGASDSSLTGLCARLERHLETLSRHIPEYSGDLETVTDFRVQVQDLGARLRRQPVTAADGQSIERLDARLFELAQLKRKLRRSFDEILNLREEITENLSFLDACALDLRQLEKREKEIASKLKIALEELNVARAKAASGLSADLEAALRGLGFSDQVKLRFSFSPHELYPECVENRPRMLWIPNPGQAPRPLDKIASGGELSRFLLAVISLLTRDENTTLIFDEVDSGVGGLTLNSMAQRIASLSSSHQILLITHWPQLAAKASRHFFVHKEIIGDSTHTRCRRLAGSDIVNELSRMAGGGPQGNALARELMSETKPSHGGTKRQH